MYVFMFYVLNGFYFYDLCYELWFGFVRSLLWIYILYICMVGYLLVIVRCLSVFYNGYEIFSVYGGIVVWWMIFKREWNYFWWFLCNVVYFMSEDFDY